MHFDPRTPVWNDPETIEHLAVDVDGGFKSDPRGAVQLAYHHPLRAVNDESALWRHERDFAHVHLLFLGAFFLSQLKRDMQRRAVGLSFALRLQSGQFRLANVIVTEIEYGLFIVALDRKDLLENSLQSLILSLRVRDVFLQEFDV